MSNDPVKSHQQSQQHHPQPPQQHHQPHQPLHNFSLPSFLNWPSSNGSSRVRREPNLHRAPASPPKRTDGGEHTEGDVDPKKEGMDGECSAEGEDGRKPWNLRPRRAVAGMTAAAGAGAGEHENRPRRNGEGGDQKNEKEEEGKTKRRRLWIALTKEEIEEDIFIMTGFRPSRRPKKRSKTEQKHLDCVFPGLWLVGMTADAYKVAEASLKSSLAWWGEDAEVRKKRFSNAICCILATDEDKTRCTKVSPVMSATKGLIEEVHHAKLAS